MSDKLSIGNKNHGSCVNNDSGTVSSRRSSAAWDIWDMVWRAKKEMFSIEVGSRGSERQHVTILFGLVV